MSVTVPVAVAVALAVDVSVRVPVAPAVGLHVVVMEGVLGAEMVGRVYTSFGPLLLRAVSTKGADESTLVLPFVRGTVGGVKDSEMMVTFAMDVKFAPMLSRIFAAATRLTFTAVAVT